jgi:hypothetical protein
MSHFDAVPVGSRRSGIGADANGNSRNWKTKKLKRNS